MPRASSNATRDAAPDLYTAAWHGVRACACATLHLRPRANRGTCRVAGSHEEDEEARTMPMTMKRMHFWTMA
uniref:Uncharacterized protein n=1 Tax=Setaria italica TaxID=4555 RepID=K3ZKT4_SETIT